MCTDCGCGTETATIVKPAPTGNNQEQGDITHTTLHLKQSLLSGNDQLAADNRSWLRQNRVTCVNLMGTPGAGKTQLLQTTLKHFLGAGTQVSVLEGDQHSNNDAMRIEAVGGKAIQINTGTGCHLDADMVQQGISELAPQPGSLLFVENVGNLVCPALFDIGETVRVAMMSVTDGEDKPEKYPHMFSQCDLILLNKVDLLPYLDFDVAKLEASIAKLNTKAKLLYLSAKSEQGCPRWYHWLEHQMQHQMQHHG